MSFTNCSSTRRIERTREPTDWIAVLANLKPENIQHFPGDRSAKSRFIQDEDLEHYLGPDHPLVREVEEKLKRGA
jgi:hypothetical protein